MAPGSPRRPRTGPTPPGEAAHRAFIDIVAVTIPGAAEPVTRRVFATVKDWGAGPSDRDRPGRAAGGALGGSGQRHRRARARLRRQFRSGQGACHRRARARHPRAGRAGGRVGPRLPRRLYCGAADPRPGRPGREPGAPQPRLARHRHGRRDRRRGGLRAAAEARREAGGLCGLDRDQHGGRLHVAVRHDDQAAPCRPRRQVRRAGGEPGARAASTPASPRWTDRPA